MDLSVLTTQQQSLFIFLVAMAGIMVVAVFFMWAKGWRKGSERLDPPPRFKDVSSKKTEASKFSETEVLKTEVSKAELSKSTESKFSKKLSQIFSVSKKIDDQFFESLEELLYTSDLGPTTVEKLLSSVKEKLPRGDLSDLKIIKQALYDEIVLILSQEKKSISQNTPHIILVVGVNGVGKTTTIGKLAYYYSRKNKKVMVVAADTFRAAAQEQLQVWSQRANVSFYTTDQTTDPAAVAYQGVQKALSEQSEIVIVDTAGRLHNNENLMEELKKVKRVIQKLAPSEPSEILLVIDGNSGQNAFHQAREFHSTLTLTGLVVTKLDGSAKGGVIVGIANELQVHPQFVGLGEKMTDLEEFSIPNFTKDLLSI